MNVRISFVLACIFNDRSVGFTDSIFVLNIYLDTTGIGFMQYLRGDYLHNNRETNFLGEFDSFFLRFCQPGDCYR